MAKPKANIYRIKVSLGQIRPPVWRRIEVPGNYTLARLHTVIQDVMGWTGDHLHSFEIDDEEFALPEVGDFDSDESKARLDRVVGKGDRFKYTYDFGDDWVHHLLVEKVFPPQPGVEYPRCVDGKRACPPEDCGGPWGYADRLEDLKDPHADCHVDAVDFFGEDFDPEEFNLENVNEGLGYLQKK
jgi:hypothetical protein